MVATMTDKIDVNERIKGHSITNGWLINSLRKNDVHFQKLHGHRGIKEIEAYDVSAGKGFASEILRCIIKFEDSETSEEDVYTTILKIPGFEALKEEAIKNGDSSWMDNAENIKNLETVHEFECDFYANLAPILDIPVPKVYKTLLKTSESENGCLHMEDLTRRGRTLPLFENINVTQVKHIIRLLAHMHKNILSVDEKIWRGKYLKSHMLMVNVIDMFKPITETFVKKCKAKELFKPLFERNKKISESKEFATYLLTEFYKSQKPVIVHGDLHSLNIMWNIDENDDIQNSVAAFIDWQTIHEGSPMSDLARILTFCCDGGIRRQLEIFAIEFYFECLTKEFDGDISKVPYTIESLKKAYNLAFLSQAFMLPGGIAFMFGIIEDKKDISQSVKDCIWNEAELKVLHALEDADRLLSNELKEFYEKYGL